MLENSVLPFYPSLQPNRHRSDLDVFESGSITRRLLSPHRVGYQHIQGRREIFWDNAHRLEPGEQMEGVPPYCVFQYTLSGKGWFRDGTGMHHLQRGQAFLTTVPSRTSYGLKFGDTWEWIWYDFRGELAFEIVDDLIERHGHVYSIPPDSTLVRMLARLYGDASNMRVVSPYRQTATLFSFLMELSEILDSGHQRYDPAIEKALQILENRFGESTLDVSKLAEAVGLSRYHFSRAFKEATGRTPSIALKERRMNAALDRICSEVTSIKEIAHEVGYRNYSYFCSAFHQFFGFPPGQMRHRADEDTESHSSTE
ncbi:MAG: helix-turn-helix domain-containing protein [Spirochaetota bacterium]